MTYEARVGTPTPQVHIGKDNNQRKQESSKLLPPQNDTYDGAVYANRNTQYTECLVFYQQGNLLPLQSKIKGVGIQHCHCVVCRHLVKGGCLDADLMKQTVHKTGMTGSSRANSTTCDVNDNQCLEKTIRPPGLNIEGFFFFLFNIIDWTGAREGRMTANRGHNARFSTELRKARRHE